MIYKAQCTHTPPLRPTLAEPVFRFVIGQTVHTIECCMQYTCHRPPTTMATIMVYIATTMDHPQDIYSWYIYAIGFMHLNL